MMRLRVAAAAGSLALLGLAACHPTPEEEARPRYFAVRFDPGATPPVVPTPTDLIEDPGTGLLNVPEPAGASAADRALIAYLDTLDGYPLSTAGAVTFDAPLDPTTLTPATVRVLDQTAGFAPVEGVTYAYTAPGEPGAPSSLSIKPPPGGWTAGHRYSIALLGGEQGLKSGEGAKLLGSTAWLLLRSTKPLTTCEDLAAEDCRAATDLIPSTEQDPAKRLQDQAHKAVLLEGIRRKYAPSIEHLVSQGVAREDVALLWSFRAMSAPHAVLAPTLTPARVPTPTDLALDPRTGRVSAPINPGASQAEAEFLRDHLNTLKGWPASTFATVDFSAPLDEASVDAASVRFFEVNAAAAAALPEVQVRYDAAARRVTVAPVAGTWPKGRTFGVAVVSGPDVGVRTEDGRPVIGTEVWRLLSSPAPLTTCTDLAASDCAPTLKLSPMAAADAVKLEHNRRVYAPLLDALAGEGVPREHVAVLWTFTVTPDPEAFFDPGAAKPVVPFPTDLVRQNGRIAIPEPAETDPTYATIRGLNQLDGFSTTATIVSENSPVASALDDGRLTDAAVRSGAVGLLKLTAGGREPQVDVCLDCASSVDPDTQAKRVPGGASVAPQELQLVPRLPLEPATTYGVYVLAGEQDASGACTGLCDDQGRPVKATAAFALMRSSQPLARDGRSLVSVLDDEQANKLEPLRQGLQPLLAALEQQGIPRRKVALAWTFTTQSTRPVLQWLAALPTALDVPTAVTHWSTTLTTLAKNDQANPFPYDRIGNLYTGRLSLAQVTPGEAGALDATKAKVVQAPFLLVLPVVESGDPASYPVVVFQHPLTSTRMTVLGLANKVANAKMALLAIDLPRHGDRASCIGAKAATALAGATSDDAACSGGQVCDTNPDRETYGRCIPAGGPGGLMCSSLLDPTLRDDAVCYAAGQGLCMSNGLCEGGTFAEDADGQPLISGWDFISSNFFATRDNVLQGAADLAQLVRVLKATGTGSMNARTGNKLDAANLHLVGMSLGGMVGASAASVNPDVQRVALNAAGSDLPSALAYGVTPEAQAAFLSGLAASNPDAVKGSEAFDSTLNILRWILDPADAAVQVDRSVRGPEVSPLRQVLVQYIQDDPVLSPRGNNERVLACANRDAGTPQALSAVNGTDPKFDGITGRERHGYLLLGAKRTADATFQELTGGAQDQVVQFLQSGSVQ